MTDNDWDEKMEQLALEPEAIELRKAFDRALVAYWNYFASRGMAPGFKISIGELGPMPGRRLN